MNTQMYESEKTFQDYFIQQLKESQYLKFDCITALRQLKVEAIEPLSKGHAINKLDEYNKCYEVAAFTDNKWGNIPVRFYFGSMRRFTTAIPTYTDDHLTTLNEGLSLLLKDHVICEEDPEIMKEMKDRMNEEKDIFEGNDISMIVQGITMNKDVNLLWLALNMSHSDQFVHVILRKSKDLLILI